jgi:D-alanyl-D-alanine carboxypeptidase
LRELLLVSVGCASLLVGAAPAAARSTSRKRFDPQTAALVGRLARAGLGGGITGITVGISDPSLGYLVRSYGTADRRGTRMTPDMHYRIASVTKTFTADAVLHLVAQGKVGLNARLSSYVPGIPRGSAITIGDLVAMRGGVYDFTNDKGFGARYARNPLLPGWNPTDVLKIIRKYPRRAKVPNRATVYSNSEYVLLGYVIQKATGESAGRYITSIIHQLGLGQTTFPAGAGLPKPFAHGYVGSGSTTRRANADVTFSNPLVPWTAGAIVSTVPDMLKYAQELGTGAGLPPRLWRLRRSWGALTDTGVRLQYGLGLTRLGDWIGHDGSIFGYSDLVFYLPAKRASVVVMANAADGNTVPAQAVWGTIVKSLYPGTLPQWP